jgi:hypothetical protein
MVLFAWSALIGVALLMAAGIIYIYQQGPGIITRSVRCPEKGGDAQVTFIQKERGFARLVIVDVTKCSLLGPGEVLCSKACRT